MAKDPHEAVDFAPAWLNFNNSNKKKSSEKSSSGNSNPQSSIITTPLKSSQETGFRTNSLGLRSTGSPSRVSGHQWNQQQSLTPRSAITRHQSVDFSPSYLDNKNDHFTHQSPSRDYKTSFQRSATFSPTLTSTKKSFSANPWKRNGSTSGIDTEFPSLSDVEVSDVKKSNNHNSPGRSTSNSVVNMWQKPLVLKSMASDTTPSSPGSNSKQNSTTMSIYKTLVPKAASSHQKQPYRRTMSVPLNLPSKSSDHTGDFISNGNKRELSLLTKFNQPSEKPTSTDILRQPTPVVQVTTTNTKTPAVSIGVFSGHKKHRKGKNHFLKALRQTEGEIDDSAGRIDSQSKSEESIGNTEPIIEEEQQPKPTNGCLDKTIIDEKMEVMEEQGSNLSNQDDFVLSSSLEAEHRLLREMGWKYPDEQTMDEEPPLTEDEIKEFQMRCNTILSPPVVAQREKALQNAFSGWKFSGIRKRSSDADFENNNNNTSNSFLLMVEENVFSQDEDNISDTEF